MAVVINTLDNAIGFINTLYEGDTTAPSSGDDDYTYWTSLINIAIGLWENEEGVLWNELFVKLEDASTGDKTTADSTYSYDCPDDFRFTASSYVWLGSGTSKTALRVLKQEEIQAHANDTGYWCYFLTDGSPTLEINPNLTITGGYTISYNYYKKASSLSASTDTFEMTDPMFAVFYALSELRRDEGDNTSAAIATQKLEAMKTLNMMPTWLQDDATNYQDEGFGT